jgi:hypothetical protein
MKKERGVWVCVAPEFRTNLKIESAKQKCSMIELSKRIQFSQDNDDMGGGKREKFTFRI